MTRLAKGGAACFILWGALHIVGGGMILLALQQGPDAAFAAYRAPDALYPALAGAILGYFAYGLVCIGAAVAAVAVLFNWKNSQSGLAANTVLTGLTEIGLVLFLLMPGYVPLLQALPGLLLFAGAMVMGGMACSRDHRLVQAG